MQPDYKARLKQFQKYNEWEHKRYRRQSGRERLQQFADLFELTFLMEAQVRKREQARHLDGLIQIQKALRDRERQ